MNLSTGPQSHETFAEKFVFQTSACDRPCSGLHNRVFDGFRSAGNDHCRLSRRRATGESDLFFL